MKHVFLSLVLAGSLVACATQEHASRTETPDRPERGKQGESLVTDQPGSILPVAYSKGVNLIGHSAIEGRDSNIQMAWADDCAYVSTSSPNFLGWGVTAAPETYGVAVIDVSNPSAPRTLKFLQDKGSLYAVEAMHAAATADRKVLAAGTYENGAKASRDARWLNIYDLSDCAQPELRAEIQWPEKIHSLTVSPNGKRVYATHIEPFSGKGGIHILDISQLDKPVYLGKFPVVNASGDAFEFATHEVSISADESRIYAGVLGSKGHDLNHGIKQFPPNAKGLGPDAGGVYIIDNSDIVAGKKNPQLRLVGTAHAGGWHSVMPANINSVPHLVGGGELGACPGAWPKIVNIADETQPVLAGEFKLEMNHRENCPPPGPAAKNSMGISPDVGTATLHFNDVDSASNTRLGLFNFMWAGLRIVDLRDPSNPEEVAYFKPGDACGGHVRYREESGHIWLTCAKSGFFVLELKQALQQSLGLNK